MTFLAAPLSYFIPLLLPWPEVVLETIKMSQGSSDTGRGSCLRLHLQVQLQARIDVVIPSLSNGADPKTSTPPLESILIYIMPVLIPKFFFGKDYTAGRNGTWRSPRHLELCHNGRGLMLPTKGVNPNPCAWQISLYKNLGFHL